MRLDLHIAKFAQIETKVPGTHAFRMELSTGLELRLRVANTGHSANQCEIKNQDIFCFVAYLWGT